MREGEGREVRLLFRGLSVIFSTGCFHRGWSVTHYIIITSPIICIVGVPTESSALSEYGCQVLLCGSQFEGFISSTATSQTQLVEPHLLQRIMINISPFLSPLNILGE